MHTALNFRERRPPLPSNPDNAHTGTKATVTKSAKGKLKNVTAAVEALIDADATHFKVTQAGSEVRVSECLSYKIWVTLASRTSAEHAAATVHAVIHTGATRSSLSYAKRETRATAAPAACAAAVSAKAGAQT
jgi:hypothetical protein